MRFLLFATLTLTLIFQSDGFAAETTDPPGLPDPAKSRVAEIIVVMKTHFDIGYTHRVRDLLSYYRTEMIDKAMGIMDQLKSLPPEQQFAWTGPGWVMAKVVEDWPGQTFERRQRIDDFFKSGRFVTHAIPFTVQSEFVEPEAFVRSFASSSFISRKYGQPLSRAAKMTDVPSHDRVLATVLAQGGVKFMHIGCNWPSGYVKYPPLFWWEGPDGSRVLTQYSCIYGTCTSLWPKEWLGKDDPDIGRGLLPPSGWPYKTWAAIIVTPDNSGPPTAEAVKGLFEEIARQLPGVKVRMGRMEEFADAILAEKPDLPVVKAEAPDTWIHGIMGDPGGVRLARNLNPLMSALETLNTELRDWKVAVPDPAKEIAQAYEQSLLYSEHTWGGAASVNQYGADFQKLPPDQTKDIEGSWEDKTDYIRSAAGIVNPLIASNLAALAQNVRIDGARLVVYNPLPWTRSGVVEVSDRRFFAKDVPPCGYKTFPTGKPGQSEVSNTHTIENEFLKIAFDSARGSIASLVDNRTGREWVDTKATEGMGQYLNERFTLEQTLKYVMDYQGGRAGDWPHPGMYKPGMISEKQVPYRAASPANGTLQVTRDALAQSATLEFPANPANHLPGAALRVTLYDGQPFIDLEITLKDKARDNWPEADWLCLPFQINSPKFRVGRVLGTMNPGEILPGANRHLYTVGAGVTLTDADGSGVAVCPLDHPLISLDQPGCWKFSNDFVPRKPVVYLNLYNNQWNTNYRCWYPGTWSSRVRLWTFGKEATVESALVTPALEARLPLMVAIADGKGGNLPPEQSGIATSRKGIQVTAYGTNPDDSKGTLLRLWEQGDVSGELTVTLPAGVKYTTATPVNLRGEKIGEPLAITGDKFTFDLGASAPASFSLQ